MSESLWLSIKEQIEASCNIGPRQWAGRCAQDLLDGPLATALAEARAEGRQQGLEEAARIVQQERRSKLAIDYDHKPVWFAHTEEIAREILALATAPAETQKPETVNLTDGAS